MSAGDHLNNIQFSSSGGEGKAWGSAYAHNGNALNEFGHRNVDNIVGNLTWGVESFLRKGQGDHKIDEVWVHPDYRRAGLASAMLGMARDTGADIEHSHERTEAGDAWAQKLGAAPAKKRAKWYNHSGAKSG